MKVVVPRELAAGETRVAATPRTVKRMDRAGLVVHIEAGAGTASGITDLEFRDAVSGRSHSLKSPTTPDNPARGLTDAIEQAGARFGFGNDDIALILHGTTIATNAVLTRDLPAGALITNEGFDPLGGTLNRS